MKKFKVYCATNKRKAVDGIAQDVSKIYQKPLYTVKPNYEQWTVDVYDRSGNLVLIFYPKVSEPTSITRKKFRPATNEEIANKSATLYVKDETGGETSKMLREIDHIDSVAYQVI